MKGIQNQRIFIAGGCGDIGRAVAVRCLDAGAKVVLGDLAATETGAEVGWALREEDCSYTRCDVSSAASVNDAFGFVERVLGGLDVFINCAGVVANAPVLEVTEADWNRTLGVNLTGSLLTAQAAARLMLRNQADGASRRGALIFTGSWVQAMPWPEGAGYCASKAGQEMLVKVMAQELAAHQITCNLVAPGIVYAGLSRAIYDRDELYRRRANQTIPLRRLCSTEEVAGAFLYLASVDAAYTTGTTILVDGGASLVRRDG
ncbi:MAG: SDR family oxidoreductase [Verrucomicrobiota bacterium]